MTKKPAKNICLKPSDGLEDVYIINEKPFLGYWGIMKLFNQLQKKLRRN